MDMVICGPSDFFQPKMSRFIARLCNDSSHQWIYNIINKNLDGSDEEIIHDTPKWCLCVDKHGGNDTRYLVIFKDTSLQTIRDLRQKNLSILYEVESFVKNWLGVESCQYKLYFHYMPSTFQLHLHINTIHAARNYQRIQPLHVVIRNLEVDNLYYQKALILTRYCKTFKRAETHAKMTVHI